jgi:hypothetical protein
MKAVANISELGMRDYNRMKETSWAGILNGKNPESKEILSTTEKEISNIKQIRQKRMDQMRAKS